MTNKESKEKDKGITGPLDQLANYTLEAERARKEEIKNQKQK